MGAHLLVLGAGGNIGSQLVPHLARMPEVGRLTLVDRDRYAPHNTLNQDLPPRSLDRPKATMQARRARRLNPLLRVDALVADLELLPLGAFRADLLIACLDSRRARQRVNDAAGRLGVPWLDGGVLGSGLLGRVTRYQPGEALPCLECRWSEADYAALEQSYPCEPAEAPPTDAPSALGALVAALLALECRQLLAGAETALAPGSELVVDAAAHRHYVSAARPNPACRRGGHGPLLLTPLAGGPRVPLRDLLAEARRRIGGNGALVLEVPERRFARELRCESCGAVRPVLRLDSALRPADRRCRACGGRAAPHGFGLVERLEPAGLTRRELGRPLSALGLGSGDVVTVTGAAGAVHLELVP